MILVISRTKSHAATLAEMFNIMGILSYPATPSEALSEISISYRAAIIISPDALPEPRDFFARLRRYHSGIPLFGISDTQKDYGVLDLVFRKGTKASELAYEISEYQKKRDLPIIGDYRLAGIDAVASERDITYFDTVLPFTKTEAMILRYLMRVYPSPMSAKDILKHALRPSRSPDEASIRTHVSKMNLKFRKFSGRNIIYHAEKIGYTVLTPELMNKTR